MPWARPKSFRHAPDCPAPCSRSTCACTGTLEVAHVVVCQHGNVPLSVEVTNVRGIAPLEVVATDRDTEAVGRAATIMEKVNPKPGFEAVADDRDTLAVCVEI